MVLKLSEVRLSSSPHRMQWMRRPEIFSTPSQYVANSPQNNARTEAEKNDTQPVRWLFMQRSLSMAELQIDCCEKMVGIVVVVAASKSSALRVFFHY